MKEQDKVEEGVGVYIVHCVKMRKDLLSSKTLHKIAIEESHWNTRNVKLL